MSGKNLKMQATGWKLDEAIQLFYVGNDGGLGTQSVYSPSQESDMPLDHPNLRRVHLQKHEPFSGVF